MDPGRRQHYADFYDGPPGDEPLALVLGNCQAESVRVLLAGSPTLGLRAVRMPPVHELEPADLAPLHALLPRVALLASQPVRDSYRGLPVGTREVAARLPAGAAVIRWPVIRYAGLHPWYAIVRHPDDMSAVPPLVPYHDLRVLAEAAGRPLHDAELAPERVRELAELSLHDLRIREQGRTDVAVSDLLPAAGADAAHTLNHPGNTVLIGLARRIQQAYGRPPDATDPGRTLLGSVHAPRRPEVLAALGLDPAGAREAWTVDGAAVSEAAVRRAHLPWYAVRPQWVAAGLDRHADRLRLLGRAT